MRFIHAPEAPRPIGPYSQAVEQAGWVFCSGQIGIDASTGTIARDVGTQTRQALSNLERVLYAADCAAGDVVQTTLFLVNVGDFAEVNRIYGEFFGGHRPARSTVGVKELPRGALIHAPLIEIEAVAHRRNRRS